jgi:hypothetical protein
MAIAAKDFGQTGVSCWQGRQFALTIRCERQTGANIFERQIWEFSYDLLGVIPPARYSNTSVTVIRKPRMHGLPLRLSGSIVMIFV